MEEGSSSLTVCTADPHPPVLPRRCYLLGMVKKGKPFMSVTPCVPSACGTLRVVYFILSFTCLASPSCSGLFKTSPSTLARGMDTMSRLSEREPFLKSTTMAPVCPCVGPFLILSLALLPRKTPCQLIFPLLSLDIENFSPRGVIEIQIWRILLIYRYMQSQPFCKDPLPITPLHRIIDEYNAAAIGSFFQALRVNLDGPQVRRMEVCGISRLHRSPVPYRVNVLVLVLRICALQIFFANGDASVPANLAFTQSRRS